MNGHSPLHLWLIPVLPFVGFLLNGLLGRRLPNAVVSTIALLFTAAPLAMVLEYSRSRSDSPAPEPCCRPPPANDSRRRGETYFNRAISTCSFASRLCA